MSGVLNYVWMVVISGAMCYYLATYRAYKQLKRSTRWLTMAVLWVVGGLTYYLCMQKFGFGIMSMTYYVITVLLVLFALIDLISKEVPSDLLYAAIVAGGISLVFNPNAIWYMHLLAFAVGIAIMLVMTKVTRGAIGDGDIYLIAIVALFLGWQQGFIVFLLALVLSGVVGIVLLVSQLVTNKTVIPFVPFIAAVQIMLLFI